MSMLNAFLNLYLSLQSIESLVSLNIDVCPERDFWKNYKKFEFLQRIFVREIVLYLPNIHLCRYIIFYDFVLFSIYTPCVVW